VGVIRMTVVWARRGPGPGKSLRKAFTARARAAGVPRLYLETNAGLGPALGLYRAVGFTDIPPRDTEYSRCDVWMELVFPAE